MEELPVVAGSCRLDSVELGRQLSRYRLIGLGARVVRDSPRQLVIQVHPGVPDLVVEEALTVERSCCPFFNIEWFADGRRLSIRVSQADEMPALQAIRDAIGVPLSLGR